MKTLGIIAEYNPFHQGHKYHIKESIKRTSADAVIAVMSGNFLQRGTPAIINQFSRAEIALQEGIDLVVQLPTAYTIRSAPNFAYGAVSLLENSGVVDYISFGSESGELDLLQELAELLVAEPVALSNLIQKNLALGQSYPQAKSEAVISYLKQNYNQDYVKRAKQALTTPNNILAIEYLKSLISLNSPIEPLTIKRKGSTYHKKEMTSLPSATAIRAQIKKQNNYNCLNPQLKNKLLHSSSEILSRELKAGRGPIFFNGFNKAILTILRRINKQELKKYEDISAGLENRIITAAKRSSSLAELLAKIKTKRYTQTRIQRIITQVMIDLKETTLADFDQHRGPEYLRVLGFNKQGRRLLKKIKTDSKLPIITKVANHYNSKHQAKTRLEKMLSIDLRANDIYSLAYQNPDHQQGGSDFKHHPIINL